MSTLSHRRATLLDWTALHNPSARSLGRDQQLQDGSGNSKHPLREVAPINGSKVPCEDHLSNQHGPQQNVSPLGQSADDCF